MISFSPFGDFSQQMGTFIIDEADKDSPAPNWFIFFSMPSCPHCKALYGTWQQVA
jgi:hypothetical protein